MIKYFVKEKFEEYIRVEYDGKSYGNKNYIADALGMSLQNFYFHMNKDIYSLEQLLLYADFLKCRITDLYISDKNSKKQKKELRQMPQLKNKVVQYNVYEKVHEYVEHSGFLHKEIAEFMGKSRFYLPMFLKKDRFSLEDLEMVASVIECKLEDLYDIVGQ